LPVAHVPGHTGANQASSVQVHINGTRIAKVIVIVNQSSNFKSETVMLTWALTFLVIALIAGVLGFGGVMTASAGIAKVLFFIFIVLFIISMVANAVRGRSVV